MKVGDFVLFSLRKHTTSGYGTKGYESFPGEYGFHSVTWVVGPLLGTVVEVRDTFCRVLVEGKLLWFEEHQLRRPHETR